MGFFFSGKVHFVRRGAGEKIQRGVFPFSSGDFFSTAPCNSQRIFGIHVCFIYVFLLSLVLHWEWSGNGGDGMVRSIGAASSQVFVLFPILRNGWTRVSLLVCCCCCICREERRKWLIGVIPCLMDLVRTNSAERWALGETWKGRELLKSLTYTPVL